MIDAARFWSKVAKTAGCWLWQGRIKHGYGYFRVPGGERRAHRVAYELLVGPIPEGLTLDHVKELCSSTACVNPAHLEPVTAVENVRRGGNSIKTHCKHGHPLSGPNLRVAPDGKRRCRECNRRAQAPYRARKAAAR